MKRPLVGAQREKRRAKKIGEKRGEIKRFSHFFSLVVFRAEPQLTERQEKANLFLVPRVSIIFRPKSFSFLGIFFFFLR